MERVNMMREKRNSISVDLIKLLKRIDNYNEVLVCVFEGEDAKYYGSRIDSVFTEIQRKNLNCKGKDNVITLREKVKENKELSKAKILYFVDADFDGNCNGDDLYCTPCYSIENLYAQVEVFKKILADEFSLCGFRDEDLIKQLCLDYEVFEKKADKALLDLNSWIWVRKEQGRDGLGVKLNLNNLNLDKVMSFNNSVPIKNYTIESLDEIFSISIPIDHDKLNSANHYLSERNLAMVSRGKFRIEYFRFYLSVVVDNARKKEGRFTNRKANPRITLSKAQVLSELTQYAVTPDCLICFLNRNKTALAA